MNSNLDNLIGKRVRFLGKDDSGVIEVAVYETTTVKMKAVTTVRLWVRHDQGTMTSIRLDQVVFESQAAQEKREAQAQYEHCSYALFHESWNHRDGGYNLTFDNLYSTLEKAKKVGEEHAAKGEYMHILVWNNIDEEPVPWPEGRHEWYFEGKGKEWEFGKGRRDRVHEKARESKEINNHWKKPGVF